MTMLVGFQEEHLHLNEKPQNNLGRAASPPLMQGMDSSAACVTRCAMPTADESNHTAMSMLKPHFLYVTGGSLISLQEKLPLPSGDLYPHH